jgi:hypothetical protein
MEKTWHKTGEGSYTLLVDGQEMGQLAMKANGSSGKAVGKLSGREFTIQRTGFWKTGLEIAATTGPLIARTYQEKWYAKAAVLDYQNKKYQLVMRNNPLAEWAILDQKKVVLAYGLTADNGRVAARITTSDHQTDYLLDFILWYLFVPLASEDGGDDFLMLL